MTTRPSAMRVRLRRATRNGLGSEVRCPFAEGDRIGGGVSVVAMRSPSQLARVLTACTSPTRTLMTELRSRVPSAPPLGAPTATHEARHTTVTVAAYALPGWEADDREYVYAQE